MFKITSIGEILFDCYPGSVHLGGAPFNFIYHINKLTSYGNFISSIGSDELGQEIITFLQSEGISTKFIKVDKRHPTGTVDIRLDKNKVPEYKININTAYDFIEISDEIRSAVKSSDLFYFGTLAQRNDVTGNTIFELSKSGAPVMLDLNLRQNWYSKEVILRSLNRTDILKLNNDELGLLKSIFKLKDCAENKLIIEVYEKFHLKLICLTKGENGSVIYDGNNFDSCNSPSFNPVDTVGAGDGFSTILVLGFLSNYPIKKINYLANKFASDICKINGAFPDSDRFYKDFRKEFKQYEK